MKTLPILLTLAVVAGCHCGDSTEPTPNPADAGLQPVVEPTPPVVDPLVEARARLDLGLAADALPALETALAAAPTDAALWFELELAALGSGDPGALLDRLSVTEAIGGQDALHHSLRATLALAAGRPADAKDAAQALRASDPGAAAAFLAQAAMKGFSLEGVALDPAVPADALVLAATEKDPKKLTKLLESASQVPGWRAAEVRAAVWLRLSDPARAQAEVERMAAAAEGPRPAAAALRLRLLLSQDALGMATLALDGATAALQVHDGLGASALLAQGVDLLMKAGEADKAFAAAQAMVAGLPETDGPTRDRALELEAVTGPAAGKLAESLELGAKALPAGATGDHAVAMARGLAQAGWRTCDTQALTLAAGVLAAEEATWIAGMSALCAGDVDTAREKLVPGGGSGPLAVDAALARTWAWGGRPEVLAAGRDAVAAADTLGWRTARLEARLTLERQARMQGEGAIAAKVLAELAEGASPALQAELYARHLAADGSVTAPAPFPNEPAVVASWRALTDSTVALPAQPTPADPAATPAASSGMAAWAEARRALAGGEAVKAGDAYRRAMTGVPVQRQGRWGPLLVLDGADGPDLGTDVRLAMAQIGRGGEESLLALHEFAHYRAFQRLAAGVGFDWTTALAPEVASAVRLAAATEHARTLLWLAGTAEFPTAARDAARAAQPQQRCFTGMVKPLTVSEVRTSYPEAAIFSMRLGDTSGELLLITPNNVLAKRFDDPDELRAAVQGYLDALHQGPAFGGAATNPRYGDQFRHEVIDSVVGELVGIARYLVVADPEILRMPWAVLPEQMEGRRYLADIRTVAAMPYLGAAPTPAAPPEGGYKPDFLGLNREDLPDLQHMSPEELAITDDVTRTMLEAGLRPQGETASIGRLFGGGYSVVLQGDEVTKAAFEGSATGEGGLSKARYVHLTGIPAASGGGFTWKDGTTDLPPIACGTTCARLVTISTGPSPEVQIVRAQILREAGAKGVLVAMWDVPPILRTRYLTSVYDALNREHAPARALAEARETLLAADLAGESHQNDPSYWGAFLYLGAP